MSKNNISIELLKNILVFIQEAKDEYGLTNSSDMFTANMAFKAVAIDLIQIGENVNKIFKNDQELLSTEPDIPWRDIVGMRNMAVHDYDGLNKEEISSSIKIDIPDLEKAIKRLLNKTKN